MSDFQHYRKLSLKDCDYNEEFPQTIAPYIT